MALRKAETETFGSSVSEVRTKSTVVGPDTDSQVRRASSEPSVEAIYATNSLFNVCCY